MSYTPSGGFDVSTDNSTTSALSAGSTYTGTSEDVSAYNQIHVTLKMSPNVIPDGDATTAQGSLWIDFSDDGTNWDIQVPSFVRTGIFIPYTFVAVKTYYRIRYINDGGSSAITALGLDETAGTPTDQTAFRLTTILLHSGTKDLGRTIDQSVSGSDPVTLSRNVNTGKNPQGEYVNLRADGLGFSTNTNLGIAGSYSSGVLSLVGYTQVQTHVLSDEDGSLQVDFYNDFAGTDLLRSLTIPYTGGSGFKMFSAPAFTNYVEYTYTNGLTAQGDFYLDTKFITKALSGQVLGMEDFISPSMVANLGRNVLVGVDPSGNYENVEISDRKELFTIASESVLNFRLRYSESAINGNSYALLIDLSDTTLFPHTNTGYIELSTLKMVIDRSSTNSVGAVSVGVVTAITAVSATIEYGFKAGFSKSDQRRILSISNFSPSRLKFSTSGGAWTGGITNDFETTVSVNSLTTLKCTTGVATIPAVGDIIVRFEESGSGDYDFGLETDYHSEA